MTNNTDLLAPFAAFLETCAIELFHVPAARWDYLTGRIEKLARKQAKLAARGALADSDPIRVEHVATELRPPLCRNCRAERERHSRDGGCINVVGASWWDAGPERVYYVARIYGAAPKLAGWAFLATLQHEDAGTILRTVPGAHVTRGELDRFRALTAPSCEHCKVARRRKDSFVVRAADGAVRQVGRNCLSAYLGGASPRGVAALAELLVAARVAAEDAEEWGGGHDEPVAARGEYLIHVAAHIRQSGWVSRGAARDQGGSATADEAWQSLFPRPAARDDARKFCASITDEDRALASAALARAAADLTEDADLGDYEHNLRIALVSEGVSGKRSGLVASVVSWYQRKIGAEVERERRADSDHVGAVGDKIVRDLTVSAIHDAESDFGISHGHKFLDADGNVYVWWTGSCRLDVGDVYRVRGTVKRHSDYKGRKETQLTRCSARPVEGVVAELRGAVREHSRVGKGAAASLDDASLDALLVACMTEKEALKAARAHDRASK